MRRAREATAAEAAAVIARVRQFEPLIIVPKGYLPSGPPKLHTVKPEEAEHGRHATA